MMEITVGKFYERVRGDGTSWVVTPIHVTKRRITFRDLQQFDKGILTCTHKYFQETFKEIKNET